MAKKKTLKASKKLDDLCTESFGLSMYEKEIKTLSSEKRSEVLELAKKELGDEKSIDVTNGKVSISSTTRYSYDIEVLASLVRKKKIDLEDLLNAVSSFKKEAMLKCCGEYFDSLAEENISESARLTPNARFKVHFEDSFELIFNESKFSRKMKAKK